MQLRFTPPFYLKLTCYLIVIIALGYLMSIGQTILVPIILGILFAILLLPVARFFERRLRFSRSMASIFTTILFNVVLAGIIFIIGRQLTTVANDWPDFQEHFQEGFNDIMIWIQDTFGISMKDQSAYISQTTGKAVTRGGEIIGVTLLSLSSVILLLVFTFLFTFFMLMYRKHLAKFMLINFKEEYHPVVMEVLEQIQFMVKKYLIGLVIQMVIVSGLVFIALTIIGVKYAWLIALISGLINVLPYIGIFTALLIAVIVTFGTSPVSSVIFVIIAYVIIHAIDGNYVMPKIVGSKVKINSLIAMLGIVIGEHLWGIAGMFLAIPMIAIMKIVFDRIHELKAWGYLLGEEEDEEAPLFSSALGSIFKTGKKEISIEQMEKDRHEGCVEEEED